MNNLTIPPSPGWYENASLACAPDNTLLYTSRSELVVIHPSSLDQPAKIDAVQLTLHGHARNALPNPNWNNPDKLALTVCEDNIVRIVNVADMKVVYSHCAHTTQSDVLVGCTFAGNEKVVSVSENGFIVVWKYVTNDVTGLKDIFGCKVKVTCVSSCPHRPWLTAFGSKNGLVYVADLRKSGRVLHKMRGHDKSIMSLAWCPVPVNIFKQQLAIADKTDLNEDVAETDSSSGDVAEELANNHSNGELPPISQTKESLSSKPKLNPWVNLKHADDDEFIEEPSAERPKAEETGDFLQECRKLKDMIQQTSVDDHSPISDSAEVLNNEINKQIDLVASNVTKMKINTNAKKEEDDQNAIDLLLASSSSDGSIYIWRAGTDGHVQMALPFAKKARKYSRRDKTWITLCWIKSDILLSSSVNSQLIQWNLRSATSNITPKVVHNNHHTNLFGIATPVKICGSLEAEERNPQFYVWTSGQDRYLFCTGVGPDKRTIVSYPCIGGQVLILASSPLDPTRLAIGHSDSSARIWDLSAEHVQYVTMNKMWQKMQGRVMSLDFHPTKENLLAFGTSEGRIGFANIIQLSKPPTLLPHVFRTDICKLAWGPVGGGDYGLYACAEGKLAIYNINRSLDDPVLLDNAEFVTDISWKSDFSVLAVATKVGSVALYSPRLDLIANLYLQRKSIYKIFWHPQAAEEGAEINCSNWLAMFTNEHCVYIYDIPKKSEDGEQKSNLITTLPSSSNLLRCLCWSPHEDGVLAFAGDSGIAEVWNAKTNTHLSTYVQANYSQIGAMIWSPLNKDFLIVGSKNHMMNIWNMNEHPVQDKAVLEEQRKKVMKLLKTGKEAEEKDDSLVQDEQKAPSAKKKWNTLLNSTSKMQNCTDSVDAIKHLLYKQAEDEKVFNFLKLFGDKSEVLDLLSLEESSHTEKDSLSKLHLSLWKGDLNTRIKEAIKRETVTPWLINMSAMISPLLWLEACEAYAKLLSEREDSNPHEAASYYLACHKIEAAIDVLCAAHLYKDALVVAKCRLSSTDPTIGDILLKWAKYAQYTGLINVAAQCYVAMHNYEDAAKVLFKKTDLPSLELALQLARKCENKDLQEAISSRFEALKNEEVGAGDATTLPTRMELALAEHYAAGIECESNRSSAEPCHENEELLLDNSNE